MPNSNGTILFIDDEQNNLTSFKAAFRRKWNVLVTTEYTEALTMIKENDVHIVVADQRMPEINGSEFLSKAKELKPDAIRILLTGYADINAVIDAINKGEIYRYFQKPWNEEVLQEAFLHCIEVYKGRVELRQKNIELQNSYDELESFVYSASHDLRAPLVSILGVIKLARAQQERGETPFDYLSLIENSVDGLDKFVKNIINYYQNRKQDSVLREINMDILIDEIYANFKHYDGASNIKFEKVISGKKILKSDELRLKIILNNLVSNAIKYHDPDKSDKKVKIILENDELNFILKVEDNGLGIAQIHKERVFDMFFTGTNGKSIGTGLGLHIVQEAAIKLGGKITVESQEQLGSTFIVTAPICNE